MRITYLIYKSINGKSELAVATPEECKAIKEQNKVLPEEQKRKFVLSCCDDGTDLDLMYIEAPISEFKEWNSKHTVSERNRKEGLLFTHLSFDAPIQDTEVSSLHECVASDYNLEALALDHLLIEELAEALKAWKPWAPELLALYLSGKGRTCTAMLCEKYGLKERTIRTRKEQFKEFVKDFLK